MGFEVRLLDSNRQPFDTDIQNIGTINSCFDETVLSVTSNHTHILKNLFGIKGLGVFHKRRANETLAELLIATTKLKDDVTDDLWESTEGNVKSVLNIMANFAIANPDGVWDLL